MLEKAIANMERQRMKDEGRRKKPRRMVNSQEPQSSPVWLVQRLVHGGKDGSSGAIVMVMMAKLVGLIIGPIILLQ